MKYYLSYKEYIIKNDNDVYIKEASGASVRAKIILTNRNLMVFYKIYGDEEESLRIYPIEYINAYGGRAQVNTGGGNQPYFEIYFPDSSLYVFFGHSIKRGWQIQAEGRVQQWVSAINIAIERYEQNKNTTSYAIQPNQNYNGYTYQTPQNTSKPSFCPGCGSPITADDIFCIACGRKV